MPDETIYELDFRLREHPDYAGGTTFTKDDVAEALFDGDTEKVTPDVLQHTREVLYEWIFIQPIGWMEWLREYVNVRALGD